MLTRRTYVKMWMTTERQASYKARHESCLGATLHGKDAHSPWAPSSGVGAQIHAHPESQTPMPRGWAWMQGYEIPYSTRYPSDPTKTTSRRYCKEVSGAGSGIPAGLAAGAVQYFEDVVLGSSLKRGEADPHRYSGP